MEKITKKVLITGSNGFIGRNLSEYLNEYTDYDIYKFNWNNNLSELEVLIKKVDLVFHLAGVNRPKDEDDFQKVNVCLTKKICDFLKNSKKTRLFYFSSIQVLKNNNYGRSKKEGEEICLELAKKFNNKVNIMRLPGVFGKNCKPNYNSVVATFCHNVLNNKELTIINNKKEIELLYIHDLCNQLRELINNPDNDHFININLIYKNKISELASIINRFKNGNYKSLNEFEIKLFETYKTYKVN